LDTYLTVVDVTMIRATSLSGYPALVAELGGDPARLLKLATISPEDTLDHDRFITYQSVVNAVETAAAVTATLDFGRRLSERQGIDILGPVGVAARTASSVGEAFVIFERYLAAYGPAIEARILPAERSDRALFEFRILIDPVGPHQQTIELSLGVALRVFRFLEGAEWRPLRVHLPHSPLTPTADYRDFFGCPPKFDEPFAGFTIRAADLARPLAYDKLAHQAVLRYLDSVVPREQGVVLAVRELVRQLLPTGAASMKLVAQQLFLHPKALQRRLREEGTTFPALVDQLRKEIAARCLGETDLAFGQLARQLGYAEQSELSRSCQRWFGRAPGAHRRLLREATGARRVGTLVH
jgi:AraC-like DNA-binding protein